MKKRKKTPTIGLSLRIPLDLKERIEQAAEGVGETQQAWMIAAFEAALEN